MSDTRWWQFRQNNSGGSFDHDPTAGIDLTVIVEAHSEDEASARAQDIGLYFNGVSEGMDCECCGDRWSAGYNDSGEVPCIYGDAVRPAAEGEEPFIDWGIPSYMHPLNGKFSAVVKAIGATP